MRGVRRGGGGEGEWRVGPRTSLSTPTISWLAGGGGGAFARPSWRASSTAISCGGGRRRRRRARSNRSAESSTSRPRRTQASGPVHARARQAPGRACRRGHKRGGEGRLLPPGARARLVLDVAPVEVVIPEDHPRSCDGPLPDRLGQVVAVLRPRGGDGKGGVSGGNGRRWGRRWELAGQGD